MELLAGLQVAAIATNEVQAYEARDRLQVADWVALTGERTGLEFFILIDDASSISLGPQFQDLTAFVLEQPETTLLVLGYMRNGREGVMAVSLAHRYFATG